ncbi:uncharacterized protein LOC144349568 [Saccoglossus kowalevskii]
MTTCCKRLGKRDITRFQVFWTLIISIVCVGVALVTSWRIYIEHNYLVDDFYFFITLIPSGFLCLVVFILLFALCMPSRIGSCVRACFHSENAFYSLFWWCDPLLFMTLQVLAWVPFVSFGRVEVAHALVGENISLEPQEIYDERLSLFDDFTRPWMPTEYNLDLIMVQSCLLVLVIVRVFLPRGGISFSNILKCCALWLTEALDLLAFLDELNPDVLPHPYLPYAVALAASISSVQLFAMCTVIFYPSVYDECIEESEKRGNTVRLTLTVLSAFVDDIPLLIIRVLILNDIYLPLKQINALYFFFIIKSFLFGTMGVALAITEGVKCTSRKINTNRASVSPASMKENESKIEIIEL